MRLPKALRIALYPLSVVFRWYVAMRTGFYSRGWLRQKRLNVPVISVGNLTVGGTGKTPMVLWLAEKFVAEGKSVAILSRGYRGQHGTGDEVETLKQRLHSSVRFGVGADRFASARRLQEERPVDIFLLDDGFQHLPLARDLDIVMLDGSRKLRNEWLLPAGSLREPVSACRRADVLIVTRKFERPDIEAEDADKCSIFYAQTRLLGFRRFGSPEPPVYLSEIGSGPFFAFCGIGNPDGFLADLDRWHVPLADYRTFRDHHKYSRRDIEKLDQAASTARATGFITTEKDAQNLPATGGRLPVWVVVIDLVFTAESELVAAIERRLECRRGAAA